ncbi:hypothetical protein P7C73_g1832, partial [Tremellales sp. Uapishka_1]
MTSYPHPHAMIQQLQEKATEIMLRSYPLKDLPLRIRPAIIFATAAWMLILGVLGFAPLPTLPLNDKILHFFGLGFATFLIYFVIEVPEGPARRVWYIRRAPLLLTLVLAFFFGGIVSEVVQSALPANLLGSLTFLYLAHLLYQRSRRRSELSTLYQPISVQSSATYRDAQGRQHPFNSSNPLPTIPEGTPTNTNRKGSDVWDEYDESGDESGRPADGGESEGSREVFSLGEEELV